MKYIDFKNILEAIGMMAIVASLIFVGVQLQQDRNIAESALLTSDQELELVFAQLGQESPDVWRKGLAGGELTEDEEVIFDLMAYTLFRMNANSFRRNSVFEGVTIGSTNDEPRNYAFFIYENPGLREWFNRLTEVRGTIDRAFGGSGELKFFPVRVHELLLQLDEEQPELPEKRFYPY